MPFSDHMKVGTPSGRFMIVNEDLVDAVPFYKKLTDEKYPFRLVASPGIHTLNSEFRDRKDLTQKRGEQKLIIHTLDALDRQIEDGQNVKVFNDLSSSVFRAVVTDRIARGNVICEGIYRMDDCKGGRTFNALLSERLSDMGEGTTMNDNRVDITAL